MARRILVVDDEETIREIVRSMLKFTSYQCEEASSGNKALAVLNSGQQFDLILTGLMMADLDGIGLLEAIKVQYPTLPVILMTSVHDRSVALAAIRHGASDYLLKPFERCQLYAVIGRALKGPLNMDGSTEKTTLGALVTARTQGGRNSLPPKRPSARSSVCAMKGRKVVAIARKPRSRSALLVLWDYRRSKSKLSPGVRSSTI